MKVYISKDEYYPFYLFRTEPNEWDSPQKEVEISDEEYQELKAKEELANSLQDRLRYLARSN